MRAISSLLKTGAVICAALTASVGSMTPAAHAAGVRAAFVESVAPSRPYWVAFSVPRAPTNGAFGPGASTGVLGITSVTLTNLGSAPEIATLRQVKALNGSDCAVADIFGSQKLIGRFYVQNGTTLHIPFSSPLVLEPMGGAICYAVDAFSSGIQITINGFLN